MMEAARGMAARIVAPFIKGGIRDIHRFWPMPYDERPAADVEMTEEERKKQIDDLKLLADKYLDGKES